MPSFENMDKDQLIKTLTEMQESYLQIQEQSTDLIERLGVAEAAASLGGNLDRIGLIKMVRQLTGLGLVEAKGLCDLLTHLDIEDREKKINAIVDPIEKKIGETVIIAKSVGQDVGELALRLENAKKKELAFEEAIKGLKDEMKNLERDLRYARDDVERRDNRLDEAEERNSTLQEEREEALEKLHNLEDQIESNKSILTENLKNLAKMLFSNQLSNAFDLLLEMLSPKNPTNEPEDDGIPF